MSGWFAEDALDEELRLAEEVALEQARTNFLAFVQYVSPHFAVSWHHRMIADVISAVIRGEKTRVIISAPPRHSKSQLISHHLPAFLFGLDPDTTIIAASYAADLAQTNNRMVQRIIDTPEYARIFPETSLNSSNIRSSSRGSFLRNSDTFEIVGHRGKYKNAGVGGSVTGHGGFYLLGDDFLRGHADAQSETITDGQWEWYNSDFRTRLAKGGRIIIIQTRWVDRDIPGRLVAMSKANPDADQFEMYNLPAINEAGPNDYDPRQSGEALWPEFFPKAELLKIKATSARTFQALYQGDPVPPGGNLIKDEWFRTYRPAELPRRFDQVICSWDLAFTGKVGSARGKGSDYSVGQLWGKHAGRAYLLGQVRRQMPFTKQLEMVRWLYESSEWPVREVLVEQAANGDALVDTLRTVVPCLIAVPTGRDSKYARTDSVTPIIEAGNVYLPHEDDAGWVSDFKLECSRFPFGVFDDAVDAMSQALSRLFPPRLSMSGAMPMGVRKQAMPPLIR